MKLFHLVLLSRIELSKMAAHSSPLEKSTATATAHLRTVNKKKSFYLLYSRHDKTVQAAASIISLTKSSWQKSLTIGLISQQNINNFMLKSSTNVRTIKKELYFLVRAIKWLDLLHQLIFVCVFCESSSSSSSIAPYFTTKKTTLFIPPPLLVVSHSIKKVWKYKSKNKY